MTVTELIEFLQQVGNKDLDVFIIGEGGFYTPCLEDSGEAKDESGEEMFVLMPCYGHGEKLEIAVKPEDFEINGN
jgi:hypothetical protein